MMETIKFDLSKKSGAFKILNATNGGPWYEPHRKTQLLNNFEAYKAANIPYQRNHDAGLYSIYGAPHCHDITNIFTDFGADPYDPASYDFACTDAAVFVSLQAGTKTFFRLGQSIEHQVKKYGTVPPPDFHKWAVICEHIIRHYNEGWAGGYHLDMPYWEIWNEPDLDPDDRTDKRTWGGTKRQFFDLYEIAAKHLKSCFPALKIGGPALAHNEEWAEEFLTEMKRREVPIDFFSWHCYAFTPKKLAEKAKGIKELLVKCGYPDAESILNEWNYIKNWTDQFAYSIRSIHGLKSASFIAAAMSECQFAPVDMLMYYDTCPSIFCGIFDYYTYKPLKGYYPLCWYGRFYDLAYCVKSENEADDLYPLCGVSKDGKVLAMLTYYRDEDDAENRTVSLDFGKTGHFEIALVDETHNGDVITVTDTLEFTMTPNSVILIKEI